MHGGRMDGCMKCRVTHIDVIWSSHPPYVRVTQTWENYGSQGWRDPGPTNVGTPSLVNFPTVWEPVRWKLKWGFKNGSELPEPTKCWKCTTEILGVLRCLTQDVNCQVLTLLVLWSWFKIQLTQNPAKWVWVAPDYLWLCSALVDCRLHFKGI